MKVKDCLLAELPHASHTLWAVPHIHVFAQCKVSDNVEAKLCPTPRCSNCIGKSCMQALGRMAQKQVHPVLQIRRAGLYGLIVWGAALMGSEDVICP